MEHALLIHHAKTYAEVKARGAIWVQGFNGKWHSEYKSPAKKFLMRFDEAVQRQIIRLVPGQSAKQISIQEIIANAERT